MRSNSGLRRIRLSFVGNGQPLATLGPASFEDNSTVLGRHPDPEAVRLLAAPGVGLVGALAFHAEPAVTEFVVSEPVARVSRGGIFNTNLINSQLPNSNARVRRRCALGIGSWYLGFACYSRGLPRARRRARGSPASVSAPR